MCGKTWLQPPSSCRMRRCGCAWSLVSRSSDVGMVDLLAVGLAAVFAPYLLPPVRAPQSRGLAMACPGDPARPRGAGFVASWRSLAGSHRRNHPCRLLAVRRVDLLARPLRHDQL